MSVIFSGRAWDQYASWHDEALEVVTKIHALIRDARRNPFVGIGHPEPSRGKLSCWWSRRITQEHRLVYRVTGKGDEKAIEIASCRLHYGT